jgi:hypothetical protein
MVRGALAVVLSVVGLLGVSCASVGPTKLVSTHTAYNDAVQLTVTREVLSNIVRSRYADPMLFVAVSTINAQFSVSAGGSAGVAGGGGAGTTGEVGASVGYSDSPTITFVPQSDNAFYKSLYGLFEVSEAVGFALSYRFGQADPAWQALRLRFWFAAINGASDYARGESRALYDERLDALVRLLQHGAFFQQVPEWDADTTAFPKWKVFGEDMVAAFRMGMFFVEEDDGESVRLARHRLVLALVLPDPDDPEVAEALEDLGVTPGRSRYVFRPPTDAMPGESDPYAIWVTPRSMGDVIHLAARFVDVPAAHEGLVPRVGLRREVSPLVSSIGIRASKEKPPFPYRVQHRGYWFYIDETEVESRMFFEGLVAAYMSRVGSKTAGDEGPQLILPVGGG